MKKVLMMILTMTIALIGTVSGLRADLVTSIPNGTVVQMPILPYPSFEGGGPHYFGPGITWTSTNTVYGIFGNSGGFGFGLNGGWTGLTMASVNSFTDSMTFAFSKPVSAVGGFINYAPPFGIGAPTTISVFDINNNLIESDPISFRSGAPTDVNTGVFYGFAESTAEISRFTLSNNYVGITNLTVEPFATPEPSSYALMALGVLCLAAGYGYRRRMTVVAA